MNYSNDLLNETQPNAEPTGDEKTLALLSHILTFVAPILGPLIIYLVKKDESEFVSYHAKESLNFQISIIIYMVLLFVTIIGIIFMWVVGLLALVLVVVATIKAAEGKLYRYPFCIRLIK